jgi:protocatechuate 3,4-dioxygenase beta subunit
MRDLTAETITEAVIGTIDKTEDPRFKQVLTSLIRHLHAFARDVELAPEEWAAAMGFLWRAGQISDDKRNEFILTSDTLGLSSLVDILHSRRGEGGTEFSLLGPFYQDDSPELAVGGDLIGDNGGKQLLVSGRVLSVGDEPLGGALLDVWQTAGNGLYPAQDPAQPADNLRRKMRADGDGCYRFTTVRPQAYTVPDDGPVGDVLRATGRHAWRPAHIHFKVSAPGFTPLVTELYMSDDPYLDEDAVFGVRASLTPPMVPVASAEEAAGHGLAAPFHKIEFDFKLRPDDAATA